MANSLSSLADNLDEEGYKINCKYIYGSKKCEICRIKCKNCECCLEYLNLRDDLMLYKCLCCNRNYQKTFDENLKKRFANLYKFISISCFYCYDKVLSHLHT